MRTSSGPRRRSGSTAARPEATDEGAALAAGRSQRAAYTGCDGQFADAERRDQRGLSARARARSGRSSSGSPRTEASSSGQCLARDAARDPRTRANSGAPSAWPRPRACARARAPMLSHTPRGGMVPRGRNSSRHVEPTHAPGGRAHVRFQSGTPPRVVATGNSRGFPGCLGASPGCGCGPGVPRALLCAHTLRAPRRGCGSGSVHRRAGATAPVPASVCGRAAALPAPTDRAACCTSVNRVWGACRPVVRPCPFLYARPGRGGPRPLAVRAHVRRAIPGGGTGTPSIEWSQTERGGCQPQPVGGQDANLDQVRARPRTQTV